MLNFVARFINYKQNGMRNYNLGFISDENIYNHVRETVTRYSASIDLKEFNKNHFVCGIRLGGHSKAVLCAI